MDLREQDAYRRGWRLLVWAWAAAALAELILLRAGLAIMVCAMRGGGCGSVPTPTRILFELGTECVVVGAILISLLAVLAATWGPARRWLAWLYASVMVFVCVGAALWAVLAFAPLAGHSFHGSGR